MASRLVIYIGCLILALSCNQKRDLDKFSSRIKQKFAETPGKFAVAFKNLETGETLLINEDSLYHAASVMKVPVMIEVYKQAAEELFQLTDSVPITNEFRSIVDGSTYALTPEDDSDKELYSRVGQKESIGNLVQRMITLSSNLATNILIEKVRPTEIMATMKAMGTTKLTVLRGVEDGKAFEAGLNNRVTAYDLMLIFEKIAVGKAVNDLASAEMEKILLDQKFNSIIPALLPKDIKVAHKTGWIRNLHHDAGIVILPDGRKYILILLASRLEHEENAIRTMAGVSEMIFDYVN